VTRSGIAAVAAVAALGGCGGDGEPAAEPMPLAAGDSGPVHVHGLGYDAGSGTLYIATHSGLFRLAADAEKATRVGDSRQDTMGFSLVAPDRFLGSGHPDARDDLPPHLGLIVSRDRGRSWRSVSLSGEADFHVLRASGRVVYGFDASNERLLASEDGGRTWSSRPAPESLVDLAIDPADPERLVASGGAALYVSGDGGRSWSPVASGISGHLAWPAAGRLYLATLDGDFLTATSPDGSWRPRAGLGDPVAALHAGDERRLFAALHDGTIMYSANGGATWGVRATA
jgi:hypothetical protein